VHARASACAREGAEGEPGTGGAPDGGRGPLWREVRGRFAGLFGEEAARSWLDPCGVREGPGGTVVIASGNRFVIEKLGHEHAFGLWRGLGLPLRVERADGSAVWEAREPPPVATVAALLAEAAADGAGNERAPP
jgi:hypothetical protein